jgi:hypothetical protein
VNGAEDSPDAVHAGNQLFLDWLRGLLQLPARPWALARWEGLQILLIDRASPGLRLPARQGVGLARKIASDIALMLHAAGKIRSPWMGCTDADVELPPDYLSSLPSGTVVSTSSVDASFGSKHNPAFSGALNRLYHPHRIERRP